MLHPFAHPVACCCLLFGIVARSLKQVDRLSEQLPTFLLFRDRRSAAKQVEPVFTALSTLLGPHKHILYGLHGDSKALSLSHTTPERPYIVGSGCVRLQGAFLEHIDGLMFISTNVRVVSVYVSSSRSVITVSCLRSIFY